MYLWLDKEGQYQVEMVRRLESPERQVHANRLVVDLHKTLIPSIRFIDLLLK